MAMDDLPRFTAKPDVVLTLNEVAEAIPHLAWYALETFDEPIVMKPSAIPSRKFPIPTTFECEFTARGRLDEAVLVLTPREIWDHHRKPVSDD